MVPKLGADEYLIELQRIESLFSGAILPQDAVGRIPAMARTAVCEEFLANAYRFRRMAVPDPRPANPRGSFLLFYPEDTMSDQLAEEATGGYFDENNCPPPGGFVALIVGKGRLLGKQREDMNRVLVWVPEPLVVRVNKGVSVNAEQCIEWLHHSSDDQQEALQLCQELEIRGVQFVYLDGARLSL